MPRITCTVIGSALITLLFGWGAPGQEQSGTLPENTPPTGIFTSIVRQRPPLESGRTNSLPLFTLQLQTNGTYNVRCTIPDPDRSIVGDTGPFGGGHYFGIAYGTWQWNQSRKEVVLTQTNSNHHMRLPFACVLRVDEHNLARLEDVSSPKRIPGSPFLTRQTQ